MKKTITIKKEDLYFDPLKIIGINRIDIIDDGGIKVQIELEVNDGE